MFVVYCITVSKTISVYTMRYSSENVAIIPSVCAAEGWAAGVSRGGAGSAGGACSPSEREQISHPGEGRPAS